MKRVNCNGTVLVLDNEGLFDLMVEIQADMRDAVIVPHERGFVIDSLRNSQSVLVVVDDIPADVLVGVAA